MRRPSLYQFFIQGKVKHIVALAVILVFLLVFLPKTGLYDISLPGWQGSSALAEIDKGYQPDTKAAEVNNAIPTTPGEYHLVNPYLTDFSRGQSKIINDLLGNKENGFFVDIGAGDGETNSVSLFFEREKKWQGVMVEKDVSKFRAALSKNRRCLLMNLKIGQDAKDVYTKDLTISPSKLLEMTNRNAIDLLIINIHGSELELLRQIDFQKYYIKAISIELENDDHTGVYTGIADFLTSRGYKVVHHLVNIMVRKKDVIFLREL